MITSKQIIRVTRDDPRFDTIYEALKAQGFRIDEDTMSAIFTKSDICGPIYSSDAEMTKLNEDDEQIETKEIIRCRDCVYSEDTYHDGDCYCNRPKESLQYIGDWGHYCGWAMRKE